jgi:hypothetical protein
MLYTSEQKNAHREQLANYLAQHEFITPKKAGHLLNVSRAYTTYLMSSSKTFKKILRSPMNVPGNKRIAWKLT